MHVQELILSSCSSSSSPGTIVFSSINTGVTLASFKQTNSARHSTAFVPSRNGQGGFMLVAQPHKSILNIYTFQRDQIALKIVLPENLTCMALDHQGEFCAGGSAQGRIYLWEVASGILFNSWDAHYRQVNVLRFSHDGAALLSGSDDSSTNVWIVSRLLDEDLQDDLPAPYCTLSDHTLPITDIICGLGAFPTCRVLTSSLDHTVKMWDLSSKCLITTFQFPRPIDCLAWDSTERLFFAGSADGSIHQVNLFRHVNDGRTEAVGGGGSIDLVRIEENDPHDRRKRLISAGDAVTSMAISLTSAFLVVGTSTGLVQIYDISSHQLIRTVTSQKGSPICYVATLLKPVDLVGHVNLDSGIAASSDSKDAFPVTPFAAFQRVRDAKTRQAHEVMVLLPYPDETKASPTDCTEEELYEDHAFFISPSTAPSDSGASLQSKVDSLESEVAKLQEQLSRAKGVNDLMWENVVQKVVNGAIGTKENGDSMEVDYPKQNGSSPRKRMRQ